MKKTLFIVLATSLLVLGAGVTAAQHPNESAQMFCPACWTYLSGPSAMDMRGNCSSCGKYPVELTVEAVEWFWCSFRSQWLREPCPQAAKEGCCVRERSIALIIEGAEEPPKAWYCPADRSFETFPLPALGSRVCRQCGRLAAEVPVASRAWYWCDREGVWGTETCPDNLIKKCCVKFQGRLLAKPASGPIAK